MESVDYWRLCDELSVIDAALLIVGEDPALSRDYTEEWNPDSQPIGYTAAITALKNAVMSEKIAASIRHGQLITYIPDEINGMRGTKMVASYVPDWLLTTITVEDLRSWLSSRGFKHGFFFSNIDKTGPEYLDKAHPNYAPKLGAAVEAWQAIVNDESALNGKTPKQALEIWLRKNADRFGLTKEDGNPNEQGIEDVCKIANWNTKGGAPKTPGG